MQWLHDLVSFICHLGMLTASLPVVFISTHIFPLLLQLLPPPLLFSVCHALIVHDDATLTVTASQLITQHCDRLAAKCRN